MLLNPSHTITLSGLPPDLLDAYVRYKKGTRAITAWLLQYGSERYRNAKRLAISDMWALAKIVSGKRARMPDAVDFQFRETIAARKYISKNFRKQEGSEESLHTINHEHFTMSLTQIYTNLCQCCRRAQIDCQKPIPVQVCPERVHASVELLENRFGALAIHLPPFTDDSEDGIADNICVECASNTLNSCQGVAEGRCFSDDDLVDTIGYISVLQQMHDIRTALIDCWTQVESSGTPLTVPACITNVGMVLMKNLACRFLEIDEEVDLEAVHQKCHMYQGLCSTGIGVEGVNKPSWYQMLEDVKMALHVLKHYVNGDNKTVLSAPVQKPLEHIPRPTPDSPLADVQCLRKLMQAVASQISRQVTATAHSANASIAGSSTPLLPELRHLLTLTQDKPDRLSEIHTALILDILLKSYQYHLYLPLPMTADGPSTTANPRLLTLRLASSHRATLSALLASNPPTSTSTFPCRCPQTLAHHLDTLDSDLNIFANERRWDLLYQSPWVAGNHMLEIQHRTSYYGLRLMRYRNLVGAVVHVYNALRATAGLEQVEPLERLCEQQPGLFLNAGRRVKRGFRTAYLCWRGGRLKFKKGHRGHGSERDSWCLAIPAHQARQSAGLGVGMGEVRTGTNSSLAETGSLMLKLLQNEYRVSEGMWDEVCACMRGDKNAKNRSHAERLQCLWEALSAEVLEQSSLASVEFFTLYTACVGVVERVSDGGHLDPQDKGIRCLCFVEIILAAADRVEKTGHLGAGIKGGKGIEVFGKGERELIRLVRGGLQKEFGPPELSEVELDAR